MKIWVDADACPVGIKEILYKAAERTKLKLILVANKNMRIPRSKYIEFQLVSHGLDIADNEISTKVEPGDIVITGDIPLAARIVEKNAIGINPRGEIYTADNIGERLSTRDFMDSLRSSGVETGGPSALTNKEKQLFANSLDQIITQLAK